MAIGKISTTWEKDLVPLIKNLWLHINSSRRKQAIVLVILMIISSFAEVVSIGALLPFLEVLSNPEKVFSYDIVKDFAIILNINKPDQLLFPITIMFIFASVFAGAMRIFLIWYQTKLGYAIGADLSFKIFRNSLYQPYLTHVNRNSAELITAISSKTNYVVGGIVMPALILTSSIFMFFAIISLLVFLNPLLMIISITIFASIYTIIAILAKKQIAKNGARINQEHTNVIKILQEGLGGIREVIINNMQGMYCSLYRSADIPMRQAMATNQILAQIPRYAIEAIGVTLIAVVAYSLSLKSNDFNSFVPILGVMALGAQRLLPIMQQAYGAWASAKGAQAILKDSLVLLNQKIINDDDDIQKINFRKKIQLKDVNFYYGDNNECVLKNINLSIFKGERIGIIGETGGGKSTLIDIIMGLLPLDSGSLVVDDVTVTNTNVRGWQSHIAHVPQAIFLADTSIAKNIAFGVNSENVDYKKVKYVAQQSQISDTVNSFKDGYETLVGERGVRLSGGERQRIGIARALYKASDVIVFDEATSSLDGATEKEITNAIDSLGSEITTIIVAHRVSTLKRCDKIFEISNKGVRDIGSYSEMIKDLT